MNRRVLTMSGSVAALAGALLATLWVTRPPSMPATGASPAGDFVLAASAPAPDPAAIEVLLKREIWPLPPAAYSRSSQQQGRAADGKPEEKWKLTGTYRVGTQSYVLLRQGDQTPEALKPGDKLPDGRRIVEIQEERIWVVAGGKRVPLELRPK